MKSLRDFDHSITTSVSETTSCTVVHEPLMRGFSAIGSLVNETPAAKVVSSGTAASVVVQDLTFTARTAGTAGNSLSVEYVNPSLAGQSL